MLAELLLATVLTFAASIEADLQASLEPQVSDVLLVRESTDSIEGGGSGFVEEERSFFAPTKVSESLGPVITAQSALVVDRRSGEVLFEKSPEVVRAPASITKVMTALVALQSGVNLDDTIVVSSQAAAMPGASMQLQEGDELRFGDVLTGALVASGNDAAVQLAVSTAGSVDAFVARMNETASDLGMVHTAYKNPTGLDQDGHQTSVVDIARLFDVALDEPAFLEAIETSGYSAQVQNAEDVRTVVSTNELLKSAYPRVIGGKTGFTDDAGYCMVVLSSDDDGNELISVVFGSETSDARFQDTKALVTWSHSAYSWKESF